MALSREKTTIAVLRRILGPIHGQEKRFGKLVGRSSSWVKKVSAGIVPLTERNARVVEHETGVSFKWLLGPSNRRPAVYAYSGQKPTTQPYTFEYFEWYRAKLKDGDAVVQSAFPIAAFLPDIIAVGFAAGRTRKAALFMWRLQSYIALLSEEFGSHEAAKNLSVMLLENKEGAVSLEPRGESVRLRDLWIVDKNRHRPLRFNLGSPVAQEIANKGLEELQIKAPQPDILLLGLRSEAPHSPQAAPKKKKR